LCEPQQIHRLHRIAVAIHLGIAQHRNIAADRKTGLRAVSDPHPGPGYRLEAGIGIQGRQHGIDAAEGQLDGHPIEDIAGNVEAELAAQERSGQLDGTALLPIGADFIDGRLEHDLASPSFTTGDP
jgi:hypothetical protein